MSEYGPRSWDVRDAADLQWHRDPNSRRYRSAETAMRACRWLNANVHAADLWLFRPAVDADGVHLERRFVGGDLADWIERPDLQRPHQPPGEQDQAR